MKWIFKISCALFFFGSSNCDAQDRIVFKSGEEVNAKVSRIGIDNVTYKTADNLDGPEYVIPKLEIFMIVYENGNKDVFKEEPIVQLKAAPIQVSRKKKDVWGRTRTDNMYLYRKRLGSGIAQTVIGPIFLAVGIPLFVSGVTTNSLSYPANSNSGLLIGFGVPIWVCGTVLTITGPCTIKTSLKYRKRADDLANNINFRIEPSLAHIESYTGSTVNSSTSIGIGVNIEF